MLVSLSGKGGINPGSPSTAAFTKSWYNGSEIGFLWGNTSKLYRIYVPKNGAVKSSEKLMTSKSTSEKYIHWWMHYTTVLPTSCWWKWIENMCHFLWCGFDSSGWELLGGCRCYYWQVWAMLIGWLYLKQSWSSFYSALQIIISHLIDQLNDLVKKLFGKFWLDYCNHRSTAIFNLEFVNKFLWNIFQT